MRAAKLSILSEKQNSSGNYNTAQLVSTETMLLVFIKRRSETVLGVKYRNQAYLLDSRPTT